MKKDDDYIEETWTGTCGYCDGDGLGECPECEGEGELTARYVIIARAKDTWSVLNVTEKVKLLTIWDKL